MGKEGYVWAGVGTQVPISMVAIGSHCKDLAFLQRSWGASAGLCHPLPKPCQLPPSNSQSPYYTTLHHRAPTVSLICPNGAPACPLVAILPCLGTSSLAPTSGRVSLPFSQHGPLIPRHSPASPFTCFDNLAKCLLLKEISPGHTTFWKTAKLLFPSCQQALPLSPAFFFPRNLPHSNRLTSLYYILFTYCLSPPT